ncbi:MAG TPA: hypothetical protein VN381_12895 [Anaerovoracaceae bacterium]|nr:hypothetical protein [Anaerovoracaceae bacterium]
MAIDGTYWITAKTQVGNPDAVFTLKADGEVLTGTVSAMGTTVELKNGKAHGDNFEYEIEMKGPVGKMKATVSGAIDGENISGVLKTLLGSTNFEGAKIQ